MPEGSDRGTNRKAGACLSFCLGDLEKDGRFFLCSVKAPQTHGVPLESGRAACQRMLSGLFF